jgi:diadenosine tetraphosphate (Ap4A) HIT family hydrolase
VSELFDLDVGEQQAVWALIATMRERVTAIVNVETFHIGFVEFHDCEGHLHVHVVPEVLGAGIDLPTGIEWVEA